MKIEEGYLYGEYLNYSNLIKVSHYLSLNLIGIYSI